MSFHSSFFYQFSLIITDIGFPLSLQPSPVLGVQPYPFFKTPFHNLIIFKPDIVLTSNSQFMYLIYPVGRKLSLVEMCLLHILPGDYLPGIFFGLSAIELVVPSSSLFFLFPTSAEVYFFFLPYFVGFQLFRLIVAQEGQ